MIPETIRQRLRLVTGTEFVVVGNDDVVILKKIRKITMREFDGLIRTARRQAKLAGLKPRDIANAIARGRKTD